MRIAVAGGTGLVGAHVVDIARRHGHEVVVLTRAHGVDVVSGAGVRRALAGADVVVDVSNIASLRADESMSFFVGATQTLLSAERAVGVGHHVALSIVGVDAVPEGYYAGKLAQERLIASERVPWSLLRATQFHEFAAMIFARAAIGPVHLAPRARLQPVAAREVAERLVHLAEAPPAGRVADLAGPREESLAEMVRTYARAIGYRRRMPTVSLPGAMGRAQRSGALLPTPGATLGRETFAEWLDALPDADD